MVRTRLRDGLDLRWMIDLLLYYLSVVLKPPTHKITCKDTLMRLDEALPTADSSFDLGFCV